MPHLPLRAFRVFSLFLAQWKYIADLRGTLRACLCLLAEGERMSIKSIAVGLVIAFAAIWASNNVTFVKNIVG